MFIVPLNEMINFVHLNEYLSICERDPLILWFVRERIVFVILPEWVMIETFDWEKLRYLI